MPGVLVESCSARTPVSLPSSRSTPTPLPAVFAVHSVLASPSMACLASVKSFSGRAYGLYVLAASSARSTPTSLALLVCLGSDGVVFLAGLLGVAGVLGADEAGGVAAGGVAGLLGLAALRLAGLLGLAAGGVAVLAGGAVAAGRRALVFAGERRLRVGA